MDEFTKQLRVEEEYYNQRVSQPPLEKYNGKFDKPFYKKIEPTAIKHSIETDSVNYSTRYKMEFEQAANDFWKTRPNENMQYTAGKMVGNFGSDALNNKDFFNRLSKMIKENVTIQLSTNGYTSESLKEHFVLLDSILKVISKEIETIDVGHKITPISFSAFLHGFINTYVEKMIKQK